MFIWKTWVLGLHAFTFVLTCQAQCVLSAMDDTEAEVISCLTACSCAEIQIPDGVTVNMNGNWDLTGQGALTFTIQGNGSLVFDGAELLSMAPSSMLVVENTGNTAALDQTGSPAVTRLSIGIQNYTGDQFSAIIAAGGADESGPLPVELLFFEAATDDTGVVLSWATASEMDFDFFTIERSFDGLSFEDIGMVKGRGSIDARADYSFQDESPVSGRSYYRLKATDLDGSYEYFDVLRVDFKFIEKNELVAFPSPLGQNPLNVNLKFLPNGQGTLVLYDLKGQVIYKTLINQLENQLEIDSRLGKGIYLLKVVVGKDVLQRKIIKS